MHQEDTEQPRKQNNHKNKTTTKTKQPRLYQTEACQPPTPQQDTIPDKMGLDDFTK